MFRSLSMNIVYKKDENDKFSGFVNVGFYDDTANPPEKTLKQEFTNEDDLFEALDKFLDGWPEPKLLTDS